jgi:hypothetical protein
MQLNIFTTSPSAAAPAENRSDTTAGRDESASAQIRLVRGILADLLLKDDFAFENTLLLSAVSEDLNRIVLELENLAGLQRMFELWVSDAP